MNDSILLFSGLAVEGVLNDTILPAFTAETGQVVSGTFEPTGVLVEKIMRGERPDLMIGVDTSLRDLSLGPNPVLSATSLTPLLRSGIGVAVANGRAHPRIENVEELKQALLDSEHVAYSRTGASGLYFAELLEALGIADAVNERACLIDKGFVAETLLDGRSDLAVQQIVELASVDGIQVVGPLPPPVQYHIELSVAASTTTTAAGPLLEYLYGAVAVSAYRSAGLEPMFEVRDE